MGCGLVWVVFYFVWRLPGIGLVHSVDFSLAGRGS
jgi:hypothetical protein